jgi:hypothetical protein
MKSPEYKIWARSYVKNKGNYNKLISVREILRKMKKKSLDIDISKNNKIKE